MNHLYIKNDASINTISNALFGDWSVIKRAVEEEYDRTYGAKTKRKNEKYYMGYLPRRVNEFLLL